MQGGLDCITFWKPHLVWTAFDVFPLPQLPALFSCSPLTLPSPPSPCPHPLPHFQAAAVKSIHYKRLAVGQVVAGQTAALALKKIKRSQVWGGEGVRQGVGGARGRGCGVMALSADSSVCT